LIEARDQKKLLRFQKQIAAYELLIVDELGFVPLSKTGAELLLRDAQPTLRTRLNDGHPTPHIRRAPVLFLVYPQQP